MMLSSCTSYTIGANRICMLTVSAKKFQLQKYNLNNVAQFRRFKHVQKVIRKLCSIFLYPLRGASNGLTLDVV